MTRVSLLSVFAALAAVVLPSRGASALRVAFVSDTGIGNDNPGVWTDWQGNKQGYYKLNGVNCLDFAGQPCGLYSRARDVLAAVKDNGAELIVHAGDMDYESAPRMWRYFVDETIRNRGMDFLAVKGNHDADGWDGVQNLWSGNPDGYAAQLKGTTPSRANCRGSYGEDMVCDYGPVTFVLSSVGVEEAGEGSDTNRRHYDFLERALSESKSKWKVCVWHMNMEDMQVSYKGDSTGWGAYEICRKHGAFIVTGHAHVYSRTKQMARFGTKQWSHTKKDLRVSGNDDNRIHLHPGEDDGTSAVAVVGIGGYKNEAALRGGEHWAKVYSSSCLDSDPVCEQAPDAEKFGALLCDFPDNPSSSEAECWTVTTVRPGAPDRLKRRSYRNPKDRFWLIAGEDAVRFFLIFSCGQLRRRRVLFTGCWRRKNREHVLGVSERRRTLLRREYGPQRLLRRTAARPRVPPAETVGQMRRLVAQERWILRQDLRPVRGAARGERKRRLRRERRRRGRGCGPCTRR